MGVRSCELGCFDGGWGGEYTARIERMADQKITYY